MKPLDFKTLPVSGHTAGQFFAAEIEGGNVLLYTGGRDSAAMCYVPNAPKLGELITLTSEERTSPAEYGAPPKPPATKAEIVKALEGLRDVELPTGWQRLKKAKLVALWRSLTRGMS